MTWNPLALATALQTVPEQNIDVTNSESALIIKMNDYGDLWRMGKTSSLPRGFTVKTVQCHNWIARVKSYYNYCPCVIIVHICMFRQVRLLITDLALE